MTELTYPETWQGVAKSIRALSDKNILFVTGAVKSGTTWTQLWLDRHPEIACRGEGNYFNLFAGALQSLCNGHNAHNQTELTAKSSKLPPYPAISLAHIQYLLRETVLGTMAVYAGDDTVRVVAEKTPVTIASLRTVALVIPEASFLHVVRDGRDVVVSTWHHNLRIGGDAYREQHPTPGSFIEEMAQIWVRHQTPAITFRAERPEAIRQIHYEDMLDDPLPILTGVFDWLGVDSDPAVAWACLKESSFETLADGRAPGQDDPGSFFRKGTAGQWRTEFTPAEEARFWDIAGEVMEAQGYTREGRTRR
ncbi:sulfotransferase [Rhodospirillaceae bacterium KN72]|uniref:Sulfotransferase n=1 Tax=Pacificispira spongiicola TaxID=2729598 RepID=A0A7Y0E078_9PROT|nr:sulfotransferase [Pacificispira spongiicola]NMM44832.1 sulfotransferase [Pacificispira spongiicola]